MAKTMNLPRFREPESLSETVYRYLEEAILQGKLKPGDRLKERELSETLNVSRPPIREALRQLAAEGLVRFIPRKGSIVSGATIADVEEIYEIKALLEGFAARKTASHCSNNDIIKMKNLLNKMEKLVQKKNMREYFKVSSDFHHYFNKLSGNKKLFDIYEKLTKQVLWLQINYLSLSGREIRSLNEHKQILDAFINKNPEAAEELVKKHIEFAGQKLIKELTSSREI